MHLSSNRSESLSRCAGAIGTVEFYRALLDLLPTGLKSDMRMVMRYSATAAPNYVVFDEIPQEQIEFYLQRFYRLDPFYESWRTRRATGVLHMRDLRVTRKLMTAYFEVFQPFTKMRDGLAVFLESTDDTAIALCLERGRSFSAREAAALSRWYPVLDGLNRAHERVVRLLAADPPDSTVTVDSSTLPPYDIEAASRTFLADELTTREREIVLHVVQGLSSDAIARTLGISEGTVKNHRKRLYRKLGLASERVLLARFIRHLTTQQD